MDYSHPDNARPGSSQECSPFYTERHPSYLKGRDIGRFYARTARRLRATPEEKARIERLKLAKKMKRQTLEELRPLGTILLSERRKDEIKRMLDQTTMENLFVTTNNTYDHVEDSYFKRDFLSIVNGNMMDKIGQPSGFIYVQDPRLDLAFYQHLKGKLTDNNYFDMIKQRSRLPSMSMSDSIVKLVEENQVVVISGETGCGKTTQVAQFILDHYIENKRGSVCKIVCTQPRRISAITVAERVAAERAENLGLSVGYQIRLEKKLPRDRGSITFCTTGVLLKQMETDPCLSKFSHIILDEIHERDIMSDFVIAILRELIVVRKNLKVILMSATLNSEAFSRYYNNAPHINIPGFTYPVKEYFLEDVIQRTGFRFPFENKKVPKWVACKNKKADMARNQIHNDMILPYIRDLKAQGKYSAHVYQELMNSSSEELNIYLILALLKDICKEKEEGAILVFVTGFAEISKLIGLMNNSGHFPKQQYNIFPLHSQMPTVEQKQIFQPSPPGKRKIIVSTNIAETSITIDDVVFVIDCGKIKYTTYDVETNTEILDQHWVSMANASQRKGRAGRVKPGVCFHLYTRAREMVLDKFLPPEVLRSRLDGVILTAKILQLGKVEPFFAKLMDAPDPQAVEVAINLLIRINALTEEEQLTPLGYHIAKLPIGPQMGKMVVLGAIFSCLDPILSVAASLDFKDAFQLNLETIKEADKKRCELGAGWQSDHILLHNALEIFETTTNKWKFCREYYLSFQTLTMLKDMKKQFMNYLMELNFVDCLDPKNAVNNVNSKNKSLVKAIICAGLYPNVAIANQKKSRVFIKSLTHEKLDLHPKSVLYNERHFDGPLLVYFLKQKSRSVYLHDATVVQPLPIVFFGDNYNHTLINGHHNISVNRRLKFKCTESTADIIKELRSRLNWFLEYKVSHPGVVFWDQDINEIKILKAIIELITSEDVGDLDLDDYDDYD